MPWARVLCAQNGANRLAMFYAACQVASPTCLSLPRPFAKLHDMADEGDAAQNAARHARTPEPFPPHVPWFARPQTGLLAALLALVVFSHLPYFTWLMELLLAREPGGIRACASVSAAALLFYSRRPAEVPQHAERLWLRQVSLMLAMLCGGMAAVTRPEAPTPWSFSLPVLAALCTLTLHGLAGVRRFAIPIALCAVAFPFESWFGETIDPWIQSVTAHLAAPVVHLTGLPVEVVQLGSPSLVHADLVVHVTAYCAGSQVLLGIISLALLLADVFIPEEIHKVAFVLLTPIFGFAGNVLRVSVSTHAADLWIGRGSAWNVAHDVIGYMTFLCIYAAVFAVVWRLRRRSARKRNVP